MKLCELNYQIQLSDKINRERWPMMSAKLISVYIDFFLSIAYLFFACFFSASHCHFTLDERYHVNLWHFFFSFIWIWLSTNINCVYNRNVFHFNVKQVPIWCSPKIHLESHFDAFRLCDNVIDVNELFIMCALHFHFRLLFILCTKKKKCIHVFRSLIYTLQWIFADKIKKFVVIVLWFDETYLLFLVVK